MITLSPNAKHFSCIASAMLLMILLYKGGEGRFIEPYFYERNEHLPSILNFGPTRYKIITNHKGLSLEHEYPFYEAH